MSYCRFCGREIAYKRTKNEKWMPCDAVTGEPHFCQEKSKEENKSGIITCSTCGKPIFIQKQNRKILIIDYSTLEQHKCKKGDVTRYKKYLEKIR